MSSTSSSTDEATVAEIDAGAAIDVPRIRALASRAAAEDRYALTELEGMELLDAMGLATPRRLFVRSAADVRRALRAAAEFTGAKVVVKIVSAAILHKTEAGGVKIVPNTIAGIETAVSEMEARLSGQKVEGYSINEFVSYEPSLGHEIIAGYRLAPDFGPIVSIGFGGIYAEYIAKMFRPGVATVLLSTATAERHSSSGNCRAMRSRPSFPATSGVPGPPSASTRSRSSRRLSSAPPRSSPRPAYSSSR